MHTVCRLLSILLCALSCTAPICACAQAAVPELGTFKQFDIPSNEGTDFVRRLGAGWNLGNTLDAIDDSFRGNDLDLELFFPSGSNGGAEYSAWEAGHGAL